MSDLVLASASATRAAMLRAAGVVFRAEPPHIDESAIKAGLRGEGLKPRDQADALAEAKAISLSRRRPEDLVIGADQVLAVGNTAYDKPRDRVEARVQLEALRGKTHVLHTAVVAGLGGVPIWRAVAAPRLTMRAFSDEFLESYLDRIGDEALESVGAYRLEGLGAQLFLRVEGDFFSVLGLPLLPLLDFLRTHGMAAT